MVDAIADGAKEEAGGVALVEVVGLDVSKLGKAAARKVRNVDRNLGISTLISATALNQIWDVGGRPEAWRSRPWRPAFAAASASQSRSRF